MKDMSYGTVFLGLEIRSIHGGMAASTQQGRWSQMKCTIFFLREYIVLLTGEEIFGSKCI